jgi:predicted DNA-binding ribbon-helix-helix protein
MTITTPQGLSDESPVIKRTIKIGGYVTSVSLEDAFWDALGEIAAEQGIRRIALIGAIDKSRSKQTNNLSSALRLFVLDHYRSLCRIKD